MQRDNKHRIGIVYLDCFIFSSDSPLYAKMKKRNSSQELLFTLPSICFKAR